MEFWNVGSLVGHEEKKILSNSWNKDDNKYQIQPVFEPEWHWWEANAFTTAPSLLFSEVIYQWYQGDRFLRGVIQETFLSYDVSFVFVS